MEDHATDRRGYGDDGAGLGASHQTGWTGLIARFMQMEGVLGASDVLKLGRGASAVTSVKAAEGIAFGAA